MKRRLSNTICGLKFAMEKNDFKRLKSSSGKKRNDFVANPIKKQNMTEVLVFTLHLEGDAKLTTVNKITHI